MKKDNGGQAFPMHASPYADLHQQVGMTLRDYFANDAPMPTANDIEFVMKLDCNKDPHNEKGLIRSRLEIICYLKYQFADVMIKERAKT